MNNEPHAIHETMDLIRGQVNLQLQGRDVMIPYLKGKPGGGKTQLIKKMCDDEGLLLYNVHLALAPIEEFSGLPEFVDVNYFNPVTEKEESTRGTSWTMPQIVSDIYELASKAQNENYNGVVIFFDDFHLASPAHTELGFEMFTEGKIRNFKIPNNCAFILAGNESSKAGSKSQNSAVVNRTSPYPVYTDFERWKHDYAIPHKVNEKVIAFLSNPGNHENYFHEEEATDIPWGSPRSWSRLADLMDSLEESNSLDVTRGDIYYIAAGHVSDKAAHKFAEFYELYSKTEMDKVFRGEKDFKLPDDMNDKFVNTFAAINEFINFKHTTDETAKKKIKDGTYPDPTEKLAHILVEVGKGNSEIALSGIKDMIEIERSLKGHNSFHNVKKAMTKINNDVGSKLVSGLLPGL